MGNPARSSVASRGRPEPNSPGAVRARPDGPARSVPRMPSAQQPRCCGPIRARIVDPRNPRARRVMHKPSRDHDADGRDELYASETASSSRRQQHGSRDELRALPKCPPRCDAGRNGLMDAELAESGCIALGLPTASVPDSGGIRLRCAGAAAGTVRTGPQGPTDAERGEFGARTPGPGRSRRRRIPLRNPAPWTFRATLAIWPDSAARPNHAMRRPNPASHSVHGG
jgi:hypothetical protein